MTTEQAALIAAPQLTPLEHAEHLLNTLLGDLSNVEAQLNKLNPDTTIDAVIPLWRARKSLKDALEEVQKLAE